MIGLFDMIQPPAIVVPSDTEGMMDLRPYQREDVGAVIRSWNDGKRAVVLRLATGLGKSVIAAEIARVRMTTGRVLIVVDVTSLSRDLWKTTSHHIGKPIGSFFGKSKHRWMSSPAVVCTIQSLYAGKEGQERYLDFDFREFSTIVIDECESALADRFSEVIKHAMEKNPDIRIVGMSATPFRTDGRGMCMLFDHASNEPGPLNRDIKWGINHGWLVPMRQGFVHVSLDFSTLKLRKNDDGEKDYTDAQITALFKEETHFRELALGIVKAANGEPSIVICPNSTEFADKLAHHLNAVEHGYAKAAHRGLGDKADDIIEEYKNGGFPCVVSVAMLYKGFDADRVRHVFMIRKTNSRRIYEQGLGRGTRPLAVIRASLQAEPNAIKRRDIIAASAKPYATIWDLVGLKTSVKDLSSIDILGEYPDEVKERVKKKMLEGQDEDEAAGEAKKEIDEETQERERKKRELVQISGNVTVETTSDLIANGGQRQIPASTMNMLSKAKIPQHIIDKMSLADLKRLSSKIRWRMKNDLVWSYKMGKALERVGYNKKEIEGMSWKQARSCMDAAVKNGWKRDRSKELVGATEGEI